ncbi:MAG: DUF4132 domain-containing protein [Saprospiraceae bacterium]
MKRLINKLFGKSEKKTLDKRTNIKNMEKPVFTEKTLKFLNTEYSINEQWLELFTHFILLDKHNKMPLKSWYSETKELIDKIGEDEFMSVGSKWINDCIEKSKEKQRRFANLGAVAANEQIQKDLGFNDRNIPEWVKKVYGDDIIREGFFRMKTYAYLNNFQNYFYQSLGGRILRGFIQSTVINKDSRFIELVDKLALTNPNTSQDAIHVYSQLPQEISIPRLTNLKAKAKNKNILKRIDTAITTVGEKSGRTKAEIEESVIPDFGISGDSKYIFKIDDVDCVFEIHNHKEQLIYYQLSNEKRQKTLPKKLKDAFPNEIKGFKKKVKEIKTSISSQKKRIENFYLINRVIPYSIFKENYLNNNLVNILARNLIWNFKNDNLNVNLILSDKGFTDFEGNLYSKELTGTKVSLWHPIGFESDYILNWRNYILSNEILQPFKQAFREIYIITDAELNTETYSNRYASHILNKDHVSALCKVRGWSPSGIINSGKATYKVPESDYKVEYWVSDIYLGEHSKTYGSAHISTDQVRFYKKKDQLPLSEVPAIIFTEVMRDIDLFVGVTSIGNDPEWHDRGDNGTINYWSSYSNGELTERSKTRVEILKNIIPKMKIADKCEFQGKYLKIKGSIRDYKIHMGSGNILMEPDDQYLCIVADRSAKKLKKVFIPFEGDNMLSIIISKALLLAEDSKITDPTIIRQIKRK